MLTDMLIHVSDKLDDIYDVIIASPYNEYARMKISDRTGLVTYSNTLTTNTARIANYMRVLLDTMRRDGLYQSYLSQFDDNLVCQAAKLYDIGKLGVNSTYIKKKTRLPEGQFEEIKKHPEQAKVILDNILAKTDVTQLLSVAKQFALYHHERWDGKGYPYRLREDNIPIFGRMMAVLDTYDALVSERPYKSPISHDMAVNLLENESHKQFDPEIVHIMKKYEHKFRTVSETVLTDFSDNAMELKIGG